MEEGPRTRAMRAGGGCHEVMLQEAEQPLTVRDVPFLTEELALGGYTALRLLNRKLEDGEVVVFMMDATLIFLHSMEILLIHQQKFQKQDMVYMLIK